MEGRIKSNGQGIVLYVEGRGYAASGGKHSFKDDADHPDVMIFSSDQAAEDEANTRGIPPFDVY